VQWLATPDKRFFDDLTGLPLPDDLVRRARVEEMNFMDRLKVWVIDDRNNCLAKTGKPPIPVRWVETNKGSQEEFEVRSRLVAQETKRLSQGMQASEVFSATPPLECLRIQLSILMSAPDLYGEDPKDDWVLVFLDISRAHPHSPMRRDVWTELPPEHPASQDKTKCGKLQMTLYGCRDAGQNFEWLVYEICIECGASRGETNPCVYKHVERKVSFYHHGDDFFILGRRQHTIWIKEQISRKLIVKDRGTLGGRRGDLQEINVLHRSIRWIPADVSGPERIEYVADPRHAEILQVQCGLRGAKITPVVTPGEKTSITPDVERPLPEPEVEPYRSAAMRAGYLAQDRVDIQFCAKEVARGMSTPTVRHGRLLKRMARYLAGAPNLVWVFRRQRWPRRVRMFSDTDWAGCPITRRSSSGTVATHGTHTLFTLSSTQVPISLSSAEAEFYGLTKAASRLIGLRNLLRDMGVEMFGPTEYDLATDSSAAMGVASRRGTGRIRHLETGALWVQQALSRRLFTLSKVDGKNNIADVLTKHVDKATLHRLLQLLSMRVEKSRPKLAPAADV